jgi:hypothetical protein
MIDPRFLSQLSSYDVASNVCYGPTEHTTWIDRLGWSLVLMNRAKDPARGSLTSNTLTQIGRARVPA